MIVRAVAVQVVLAAILAGVAIGPATAATPTSVDSCTTIDSPGSYVLSANVTTGVGGPCIEVTAGDVTLSGAGHSLTGPWVRGRTDSGTSVGVEIRGANVTVRDLHVAHWARGVAVVNGSNGATIAAGTVTDSDVGVALGGEDPSDQSSVQGNVLARNDVSVRVAPYGTDNVVEDNVLAEDVRPAVADVQLRSARYSVVRNNSVGEIALRWSHWNEVTGNDAHVLLQNANGNEVRGNHLHGLRVGAASENLITDNVVDDPYGRDTAIDLREGSDQNTVADNVVEDPDGGVDHGISVSDSASNTLRNNTVRNATDAGIEVIRAPKTRVLENTVVGSETRGVYVYRSHGTGVRSNTVHTTGRADYLSGGIVVRSGGQYTVAGNEMTANARIGLSLHETTDSVVRDNRAANNTGAGILLEATVGTTLEGNTVADNGRWGTLVRSGNGTRVSNTVATGNGEAGLWVRSSVAVRVENASVHRNRDGIGSYDSENVTLVGTEAANNTLTGVRVAWTDGVTITGTQAADNDRAGILVDSADHVAVRNGTANGNGGAGVHLLSADHVSVTGIDAVDNRWGVRVRDTGGASVANVTARQNAIDGVRLFESDASALTNVDATGNRFGVHLVATDGATLEGIEADDNGWAGVRVEAESWKGRGDGTAQNTTLSDLRATGNGVSGLRLVGTDSTRVTDVNLSANGYGAWLTGASRADLARTTATGADHWAFLATDGSSNVTAAGFRVDPNTTVGFTASDVAIGRLVDPPADPGGYANLGRYVDTMATSGDPSLSLSTNYTDQAVTEAGVNESTLRLWTHDGSWAELPADNDVNTMTDTVHATVTDFGVVAPLGETNTTSTTEGGT